MLTFNTITQSEVTLKYTTYFSKPQVYISIASHFYYTPILSGCGGNIEIRCNLFDLKRVERMFGWEAASAKQHSKPDSLVIQVHNYFLTVMSTVAY